MNLSPFSGEQIVQVTNPDPFAKPVLRSPVLHTPVWMIAIAQLFRLLWRLARLLVRHPVLDLSAVVLVAGLARARLARTRSHRPLHVRRRGHLAAGVAGSWTRLVAIPMRGRYRRWHYRRQWPAVMTISRLAVAYRGRILLPVLGQVTSTGYTDRLHVRLVSGQSAADFEARAGELGPRVRCLDMPHPHRRTRRGLRGTGPP